MAHQPLGAGGVGVVPGGFQQKAQKDLEKAAHVHQQAVIEAGSLMEDLINNPAVYAVAQELEGRIRHFLKNDEQSLVLLRIISKWRNIIEFAPRAAEEKVRKLLGPQLAAVANETQAAP